MMLIQKVFAANGPVDTSGVAASNLLSSWNGANLSTILIFITNVVMGIGIAATTIYLGMAGIKYMMAQGDVKVAKVAQDALTHAIIGFVIIIGAFALRSIVVNILGGTNSTFSVGGVTP